MEDLSQSENGELFGSPICGISRLQGAIGAPSRAISGLPACAEAPSIWDLINIIRTLNAGRATPVGNLTFATAHPVKRRMPKRSDQKPSNPGPDGNGKFMLGMIGLFLGVLLLGAGATMWLGGSTPMGPAIGGPFALTDANGKRFTNKDLRGSYAVIYFGYTFCPDVCPTTLNQLTEALERLGPKAQRIRPVFITIDPRRDTPAVIKQYVSAFSPSLIGLTGTDAEIGAVTREFRVYYTPHRTGDGPNDYTMDHSSVLYLLGPDGKFIAPLRADAGAEQIAADLAKQLP